MKGFLPSVQESKTSELIWSIFGFLKKVVRSRIVKWVKQVKSVSEIKVSLHVEIRPVPRINFCIFRIYLNTLLPVHIQPDIEKVRSSYGCIKSEFLTDNYSSIDQKKPFKVAWIWRQCRIRFLLFIWNVSHLTLKVFFSWTVLKHYHVLGAHYFILKVFFKPFV